MKNEFKLLDIIITKSNFYRIANINIDFSELQIDIDLDINYSVYDNVLVVSNTIIMTSISKNEIQYKVEVTVVGNFEIINNFDNSQNEEFANINASAILFPYLREHISNLTLKAGLGNVLVPIMNFVKIYKERKEKTI